jgi:hypothetical protein
MVATENRYNTLTELVACLKDKFEEKFIYSSTKDIEGREGTVKSIPAFLFRGESALYDRSLTSMQRMKMDPRLTMYDKDILEHISVYTCSEIIRQLGIVELYSSAYVQHYGLYSELVDFTEDIDTCMRFATNPDCPAGPGRIAVLDVKKAIQNAIIVDLAYHPFASRARRQKAYGIWNRTYADIKDENCIAEMGLVWYEFERNDAPPLINAMDVYNVTDDVFAGVISLIIDAYIRKHGRIRAETAEILAQRINRVPLFAVNDATFIFNWKRHMIMKDPTLEELGFPNGSWRLATLGELKCAINTKKEKENSIRLWSIGNNLNSTFKCNTKYL